MITRTRAFNDAPTKPGPDVIVTHQWDTFALCLSAQGQHTPATIYQVPDVLFSRCVVAVFQPNQFLLELQCQIDDESQSPSTRRWSLAGLVALIA